MDLLVLWLQHLRFVLWAGGLSLRAQLGHSPLMHHSHAGSDPKLVGVCSSTVFETAVLCSPKSSQEWGGGVGCAGAAAVN